MSDKPPILPDITAPQPPPLKASGLAPQVYIRRCKVMCIVLGGISVAGLAGGVFAVLNHLEPTLDPRLIIGGCYGVACFLAALLLHYRRREGYFVAVVVIFFILFLIPVGTVFGVLGLIWLNKGRSDLRHA